MTTTDEISTHPHDREWKYEGDDIFGEHQLQVWACVICNEWDLRESS